MPSASSDTLPGMAFNTQHLRLTASGPLFADRWACRVNLAEEGWGGSPPSEADVAEFGAWAVEKYAEAWAALVNTADGTGSIFPLAASLDEVKLAHIGTDGTYVQDPWVKGYGIAGRPTGKSSVSPGQVALVCGLETEKTTGRARRGRVYLPAKDMVQESTSGLIASASMTAMLATWRTFVLAVNAVGGDIANPGTLEPVVYVLSNVGAGAREVVTGVRIGNRLDIQRRRVSAYPETYSTATLA